MRMQPCGVLRSGQPMEESKVALSLNASAPALVEPLCTSISTSLTGRLAGVPLHDGGEPVVVWGSATMQVQLIVAPTQYVFPSVPVCAEPLNAPGVSLPKPAWR